MKFFKSLFNRVFLVCFSIILQTILLILGIYVFSDYFYVFQVAQYVLAAIIILSVINKNDIPEFKLPWVTLASLFPLIGVTLFICFAHTNVSKKQIKRYEENFLSAAIASGKLEKEEEKIKALAKDQYGDIRYIENSSRLPAYLAEDIRYFPTGEDFFPEFLKDLSSAKEFIFLEYFIIERGLMWDSILRILEEKIKEGVEVRVLYDDFGCASKIPSNYYKTLRKKGIKCYKFNPMYPLISGVYNNRDHRKIAVIDGKVGYTGGLNFADEYINHVRRFGYWKDNAIRLEGAAVNNLTTMFLITYSTVSKKEEDFAKYLVQRNGTPKSHGVVLPFGDGPRPLYDEYVGETIYLNIIHHAKKYVYITTPYLICDYQLLNALCIAAKRGVDVRIATPHIPDKKIIFAMTRSNYHTLIQAGVKIYEFQPGFMHAKTFLSDDTTAVVGTINLDYRSLVHHFENGVYLYQTDCLEDIKKDFEDIFAKSIIQNKKTVKLNPIVRIMISVINIFQAMF